LSLERVEKWIRNGFELGDGSGSDADMAQWVWDSIWSHIEVTTLWFILVLLLKGSLDNLVCSLNQIGSEEELDSDWRVLKGKWLLI